MAEFAGDASAEGTHLRAVMGLDAGFLHTETPSTHWHVLGVILLDDSEATERFDAELLRRVLAQRLPEVEVLRRRVIGTTQPQWAVGDVDLDLHVLEATLPDGSGLSELAALAGEIGGKPLPRDRPLWEFTVVDGLADGRRAMIGKIHHSLVDGVAAVAVLGAIFDLEPLIPGDRGADPAAVQEPGRRDYISAAARTVVDQPAVIARAITRIVRTTWRVAQRVRDSDDTVTLPMTAPRVCLSRSITARRAAAFATIGVDDVQEIRRAFGVTFNDVALAVAAGVIREWLLAAGDLPPRPLIAAIPTSVRQEEDQLSGNDVSSLFGALPTHLADAGDRVRFVAREMHGAKAFHEDLGPHTIASLALAAPWNLAAVLFRLYSDLGLASRLPPVVNLVLTSVPGPRAPLYCGGARVDALFPLGPILDGVALNVTVVSYTDVVGFGFLTCPDVCPPVDHLADAVPRAVADLVAAARAVDAAPHAVPSPPAAEEETVMNIQEQNRQAIAAIQVRRDEFYEGILHLELAVAVPAGDDPTAWGATTSAAARAMHGVLDDHIAETEAPGSFFDMVNEDSPHLVHQARKLQDQHAGLGDSLDRLASDLVAVTDDDDVEAARAQALDVMKDLLTHRHRGAELVYDAYNVDVSTGD